MCDSRAWLKMDTLNWQNKNISICFNRMMLQCCRSQLNISVLCSRLASNASPQQCYRTSHESTKNMADHRLGAAFSTPVLNYHRAVRISTKRQSARLVQTPPSCSGNFTQLRSRFFTVRNVPAAVAGTEQWLARGG